jgi:hypothetical protein
MEVQGTREECSECAVPVHTGSRGYLVVVPGNVICVTGSNTSVASGVERGTVIRLGRGDVFSNELMKKTEEG